MASPDDGPLLAAIEEGRSLDEIRLIVEADPALLRRRSGRGYLPLHHAIVKGSPSCIVRYLLERWPESIRERADDYGRNFPVHLACKRFSEMATVQLLLEAWPESLQQRNESGYLPLHLAEPLELIQYLVEMWPPSVREPSNGGKLLIHHAIEHSDPLPTLRFLVETWPESVRARDEKGRTALHCIYCALSTEAMDYLLEQGGVGLLMEADNKGYLPLHRILTSCEGGDVDEETVQYLVNRAPHSVRVRSKNGYLALHTAMEHRFPLRLIRCLVSAWPQALREENDIGYLPLHVAARVGEFQYLRYLVRQCPESVRVKTRDGWLAVHLLLNRGHDNDRFSDVQSILATARFLVRRHPRSVLEATPDGLLPLHLAVQTGFWCSFLDHETELEFVRYLVRLNPASLRAASNEFLFPFDYAIGGSFTSLPTVHFLAEQWPDVVGRSDSNGQSPMHVAAKQHPPRPDIVRFIAELRPQLLESRDVNGSLPLHAAVGHLPSRYDLIHPSDPASRAFRDHYLPNLGKSLDLVRYLADQRPQSLLEGDHRGFTPLLVALARDVQSLDVVRLLVELRPESVEVADRNGDFPLQVAVAHCQPHVPRYPGSAEDVRRPTSPLDLVQFLVERSPGSVQRKNSKGWLPLFVAASSGADLDVVFFLAVAGPDAICASRGRVEPPPPSRALKRRKLVRR